VLPFVNDGEQEVDLARMDIDLDVITVAAGVPLGVVVSDPIGVLEVEANLLDLDLATFFVPRVRPTQRKAACPCRNSMTSSIVRL
jgi:hypothetical protein